MAPRHSDLARASRRPAVILLTTAMIVTAGCSHRRSAMRPVYGSPVVSPAVVIPSAPVGTMTTEPDPTEPFLTPIPSTSSTNPGNSVIRAGISPPVPQAAEDEPSLNPPSAPASMPPPGDPASPELTRPTGARTSSIRNTSGRAILPRQASATVLVDRVKPFLATPTDLFQPVKADRPWKYVVLHHSATAKGGYDQIDHDYRKILGYEGCGYHFVIGNGTDSSDGQIEVSDRWLNQKQGVHCRNGKTGEVNEFGIGICLVGNFDQTAPTPKQIAAASALVEYLVSHYKIPADHIGTHDQFASSPIACPGKNFPRDAILGSSPLAAR